MKKAAHNAWSGIAIEHADDDFQMWK